MRRANQISSLFLMAFSAMIFASSLQLGIGSLQQPGPGFLGSCAAALLFILSAVTLVKATQKAPAADTGQASLGWKQLAKPLGLGLAMAGYTLILGFLGYLVATTLLMFAMLFLYNPRKWPIHIVVALFIANVTYAVFYKLLDVLLPAGLFRLVW